MFLLMLSGDRLQIVTQEILDILSTSTGVIYLWQGYIPQKTVSLKRATLTAIAPSLRCPVRGKYLP
jgi:hypothetical protein